MNIKIRNIKISFNLSHSYCIQGCLMKTNCGDQNNNYKHYHKSNKKAFLPP